MYNTCVNNICREKDQSQKNHVGLTLCPVQRYLIIHQLKLLQIDSFFWGGVPTCRSEYGKSNTTTRI